MLVVKCFNNASTLIKQVECNVVIISVPAEDSHGNPTQEPILIMREAGAQQYLLSCVGDDEFATIVAHYGCPVTLRTVSYEEAKQMDPKLKILLNDPKKLIIPE